MVVVVVGGGGGSGGGGGGDGSEPRMEVVVLADRSTSKSSNRTIIDEVIMRKDCPSQFSTRVYRHHRCTQLWLCNPYCNTNTKAW